MGGGGGKGQLRSSRLNNPVRQKSGYKVSVCYKKKKKKKPV